jgi:hypothetical protein
LLITVAKVVFKLWGNACMIVWMYGPCIHVLFGRLYVKRATYKRTSGARTHENIQPCMKCEAWVVDLS